MVRVKCLFLWFCVFDLLKVEQRQSFTTLDLGFDPRDRRLRGRRRGTDGHDTVLVHRLSATPHLHFWRLGSRVDPGLVRGHEWSTHRNTRLGVQGIHILFLLLHFYSFWCSYHNKTLSIRSIITISGTVSRIVYHLLVFMVMIIILITYLSSIQSLNSPFTRGRERGRFSPRSQTHCCPLTRKV